jgi:hypothetical protein
MVNIRKKKVSNNPSPNNRLPVGEHHNQRKNDGATADSREAFRPSQMVNHNINGSSNMNSNQKDDEYSEEDDDMIGSGGEADNENSDVERHNAPMGLLPISYNHTLDAELGKGNKVHDLKAARKELKTISKSGFAILFSDDLTKIHHEDFDAGVNAMALLCALMLSIPFEIVGNLDYDNLDEMRILFTKCESDEFDFDDVYSTYRGSFLATVYWAIAGMILATFYFLFKRMDEEEYKLWRWKARYLVISLFFSTAFAICSLILLTNMYFDYYLLSSDHNICNNGTLRFVLPGLCVAIAAFVWGIYLAY